jgi:hypothetical protein
VFCEYAIKLAMLSDNGIFVRVGKLPIIDQPRKEVRGCLNGLMSSVGSQPSGFLVICQDCLSEFHGERNRRYLPFAQALPVFKQGL